MAATELDVSVILPCLNEETTVAACVSKAVTAIEQAGLVGEVIVVDNGSTDRSCELAEKAGARIVPEPRRGYGYAYLGGFAAAAGRNLVLADADDTYPLDRLAEFVHKLDAGADMVMGSRFRGQIEAGAMPFLHRWVGNPVLTGLLNVLFQVRVSDAHCGMRAVRRSALEKLELRTGGMEFASEMVIKAGKADLKVEEIPIDYAVRGGTSKLRTFRDGWRHLRFMLLLSPTVTLIFPGLAALVVGLVGTLALLPGPIYLNAEWFIDVHVQIAMAGLALLGSQWLTFGVVARTFAFQSGFERSDSLVERWLRLFTLERGVVLGAVVFAAGFLIDARIAQHWVSAGFPALDRVREAVAGTLLMAMGAQVMASAFFMSMLSIKSSD